MPWQKIIEGIAKRRRLARQQGGDAAIEKHHAKGRLTIRERIAALVDKNSFQEHGKMSGAAELDEQLEIDVFSPANYVVGVAKINQRAIVVGGEDFTLKGGSPNAAGLRKSVYAEHLAIDLGLPLVRLLEGGGGSVSNAPSDPRKPQTVGSPLHELPRFQVIAQAMSRVPIVSAALGPVAGFPAGRLVASHLSIMTRETAQVMIGGPALVQRALGLRLSKDELGGAKVHARSGVVDNVVNSESEAFDVIRHFLSYLPQNSARPPIRGACDDPVDRCADELATIVPENRRHSFDVRKIINLVVDKDSFFEIAPAFGPSLVIGLARINGQSVGITANDSRHVAGAMTAAAAQKMRRQIEFCETFHLPLVNFVDEPGFMIGPQAEQAGTIRYGMAAVAAAAEATVPWASVRVHKSFGVAAAAHYGPNAYILDWPSAETGALPLEGGVAVAFGREIAAADDPEAKRAELEARLMAGRSPYQRAESFAVQELIDPRETRPHLCAWIDWNQQKIYARHDAQRFTLRP
ncbi:MAG: carboxyl transferase domain-containing protein [Pseudomonadota bacterium]